MQVKTTLHYTVKRSVAYQSVEMGAAVELTPEDGEKVTTEILDKYQRALRDRVDTVTLAAIEQVVEEAASMGQGQQKGRY